MNKKIIKNKIKQIKNNKDRQRPNDAVYKSNNNTNKLRQNSVRFKNNGPIIRHSTSNRKVYSVKKGKNRSKSNRNRQNKIGKNIFKKFFIMIIIILD